MEINKAIKKACLILAFFVALSVNYGVVNAATISVTPLSPFTAGNIVTAQVTVNTEGVAINSADAQILFPADTLEVVSIDKSGSIFSLWVEGPTFSNTSGSIIFSGGVPNPGYNGSSGKVFSIVFKAKKAGTASIAFANTNILANDGTGTNVAKAVLPLAITVQPQSQTLDVVNKIDTTVKLPSIPVVTSITHPQEDTWYMSDKVRFDWDVPRGTTEVQTLLSRSATAVPNITRDGTFSAITINDLQDGTLYFHIRYKNAGGWGPTLHRKVLTDNTAPEKFEPTTRIDGVNTFITLNAKDTSSGISKYEISIDGGEPYGVSEGSIINGEYKLPVVEGGMHNADVVVYDNAGNKRSVSIVFESPAIRAPRITSIPPKIVMNQSLEIAGISEYPRTPVNIFMQIEGREIRALKTITDDAGSFSVIVNDTIECELAACIIDTSGIASVWAQLMFNDGVLSPVSEKEYVTIENTSWMKVVYGSIETMSLVVPMVALIIVLIILVYIGWHRFFGLKRKIHNDVRDTIQDVHYAMNVYKEELTRQLDVLEKIREDRDLNRKEEKVFKELSESIDSVEKFIEKKLKKY